MATARITVVISGRGSNLAALIAASARTGFGGAVTQVISNRPQAGGLAIAKEFAIPTAVVDHASHADRATFDSALARAIDAGAPDLVILAGFMRVLTDAFVARYTGRMLNIHPSLLPAYPGLHTHRRALADGVKLSGCTVHFVTPTVDVGPIVAQAAVPVLPDDDESSLAARVQAAEHRLLPAAAHWYCVGRLALVDGRVRLQGGKFADASFMAPLPDSN